MNAQSSGAQSNGAQSNGAQSNIVDAGHRPAYAGRELPTELPGAPWELLAAWWAAAGTQARELGGAAGEAGAVTLATVDEGGAPDSRVVLVKELTTAGVVFFSGSESAKGIQLQADPRASMVWYWVPTHQQVRFRGVCEPIGKSEADAYFATRPRDSQIAARASAQSAPVASREALRQRCVDVEREFAGVDVVPAPADWMGWRLRVTSVELWCGHTDRLHDRALYVAEQPSDLDDAAAWAATRLQP